MIREPLEALIAAFNRGSLDVPSGLLSPQTTYALNGRSYESILGGSPDDALIRLLSRGAAGYRAAAKTLQYALQQPAVTIASLLDGHDVSVAQIRIEGVLRDSRDAFAFDATLELQHFEGSLRAVAASCPADALVRIAAARL